MIYLNSRPHLNPYWSSKIEYFRIFFPVVSLRSVCEISASKCSITPSADYFIILNLAPSLAGKRLDKGDSAIAID